MRVRAASIWTTRPDLQAALVQFWNDGLSCSQIAQRLGNKITRCAVIGRVCRMRHEDPASLATREVPHAKPKPRVRIRKRPPPKPPEATPAPLGPLQREDGSYCTPLTAKTGECRFGYGEASSPDFRFCGRTSQGSWCDGHKRIVFAPRHPMHGKDGASE